MKKPTSIKIIQALLIIKSVMLSLILLLIILALTLDNEIGRGMLAGLQITDTDLTSITAYITQFIIIPSVILILTFVAFYKRKYTELIIMFVIQLLATLNNIPALLLVLVQLLIILFNTNAKNYLKQLDYI